jgi:hypothetical protein
MQQSAITDITGRAVVAVTRMRDRVCRPAQSVMAGDCVSHD